MYVHEQQWGVVECRLLRLRREQSYGQVSATLLDPPASLWQQGISLDEVSFTYPGRKRPVVRDVSLHFAANTCTAIVGPSGSGKSTVAQLLTQVLQPCEGRIKLGDACMDEISRDWIRQHVAEVPQVLHLPTFSPLKLTWDLPEDLPSTSKHCQVLSYASVFRNLWCL